MNVIFMVYSKQYILSQPKSIDNNVSDHRNYTYLHMFSPPPHICKIPTSHCKWMAFPWYTVSSIFWYNKRALIIMFLTILTTHIFSPPPHLCKPQLQSSVYKIETQIMMHSWIFNKIFTIVTELKPNSVKYHLFPEKPTVQRKVKWKDLW